MKTLLQNRVARLVIAAFAVRILFVLIFPGPNYFEGISESYLSVAQNVLEGKGIVTVVDIAPLGSEQPLWSSETFIDRPLGYLFLILLPLALLGSPISVQILHALISAGSAFCVYEVGKKIFSETTAWRAAILYAVWPLSARFEIAILPDAVMPFFLLLTVWLLLRAVTEPNPFRWYFLSGLACGIGMTMRPDILLLPLFLLPLFFLLKSPAPAKGSLLFISAVVFIVGLHTVRNYGATEGEIVPLGLGNGISMWEGISQFGDTLGTVYGDERMAQREGYPSWAYPDGIARDRKRFGEALRIISEHPVWYGGIMLKRIPVLLTPDWIMTRKFSPSLNEYLHASPDHSIASFVATHPFPSLIRGILLLLQYCSIALSVIALIKLRRPALSWIPAVVIFYYIVIHIPTNTESRYLYPVIPLLLLLASHGWSIAKEKKESRDAR